MNEPTSRDLADKLLAERFEHSGPVAGAPSDPIADTPMVVTLDQLRPYELNPRVTRNPIYDEVKASIRERGLDAPPAITRRPGEVHYIIRNGGNTRLAVLRELWSETKEVRFFRIACLFRPWPERGEIIALTGHLAENELHGGLSFIERALGVEKAKELYEQEAGETLTQAELARRLCADGYPVDQPRISRMHDAVRFLLPAIPNVLFGGLGRPQVERLAALRRASERTWDARNADQRAAVDFGSVFHDALALFDGNPDTFSVERVQDELIGQMAEQLDADYDILMLEIGETENRRRALANDPALEGPSVGDALASSVISRSRGPALEPLPASESAPKRQQSHTAEGRPSPGAAVPSSETPGPARPLDDGDDERVRGHIVSPAPTTERLQKIKRLVAGESGETLPDFEANVLKAIPVQAGGLYPITDVWYIEPGLDAPDRLRAHIVQFAREIADEAGHADEVEAVDDGIGFVCTTRVLSAGTDSPSWFARAVLTLLLALSASHRSAAVPPTTIDNLRLADALGPLLLGRKDASGPAVSRLSDSGLVKLFRLLRLARRLLELEAGTPTDA